GAVLPGRRRQRHAGGRRGRRAVEPGERPAASQSQTVQRRQPEPAHRAGHVAQRVTPRVAVARRVGSRADAQPVEHDDGGALQSYTRGRRGPSEVNASRCNASPELAYSSSVMRPPPAPPSASPISVATSPTCTARPPISTMVRSIVTTPTIVQRVPPSST